MPQDPPRNLAPSVLASRLRRSLVPSSSASTQTASGFPTKLESDVRKNNFSLFINSVMGTCVPFFRTTERPSVVCSCDKSGFLVATGSGEWEHAGMNALINAGCQGLKRGPKTRSCKLRGLETKRVDYRSLNRGLCGFERGLGSRPGDLIKGAVDMKRRDNLEQLGLAAEALAGMIYVAGGWLQQEWGRMTSGLHLDNLGICRTGGTW
ncbi:hypothetical protein Bbelb_340570 [Branchiostoma belcheri]|nr:hypothetical protein Bbelb_340570 [Branchiostoma belcheri]